MKISSHAASMGLTLTVRPEGRDCVLSSYSAAGQMLGTEVNSALAHIILKVETFRLHFDGAYRTPQGKNAAKLQDHSKVEEIQHNPCLLVAVRYVPCVGYPEVSCGDQGNRTWSAAVYLLP